VIEVPGFRAEPFEALGVTRTVYRGGAGAPVLLMHEIPGITPECARFAARLVDEGFSVAMPSLLGTPMRPMNAGSLSHAVGQVCISREVRMLARHEASPLTEWLRALCRRLHEEHGGASVGAIGMCLTGNFALALSVDPWLMAPVLSQPSLPVGVSASHRAALHASPEALATLRRRTRDEGVRVLGMRFTHDRLCPPERFATLRRELGAAFEGIEIDSGPGNPHGLPRRAHSVVTLDFVDERGHPTRDALDRLLSFLRAQLGPALGAAANGGQ
jgi:dienelactone hydrolase